MEAERALYVDIISPLNRSHDSSHTTLAGRRIFDFRPDRRPGWRGSATGIELDLRSVRRRFKSYTRGNAA